MSLCPIADVGSGFGARLGLAPKGRGRNVHPLHRGVQPWHSQHRLPEPPAWHPGGEGSHRIQHTAVPSCAGAVQGLQLGKERETKGKASVIIHDDLGFEVKPGLSLRAGMQPGLLWGVGEPCIHTAKSWPCA